MARWQRTLYVVFFAQLASALGFASIFPFLPLYVEDLGRRYGLSLELLAALVYTSQALTMMITSPIWGALSDRYGRKIMVERAMFGGAIMLLLMGFVRSAEELVLLRTLQGLVTGTVSAATALVAAEAPRERTGYAMGVVQLGLWGGIAVGPLLGGAIADSVGFRATFIVTATLLTLAGALVWLGVDEDFVRESALAENSIGFFSEWRQIFAASGVATVYAIRFFNHLARMIVVPFAPLFIQQLLPTAARVATYTGFVVGLSAGAGMLSAVYLGRLGDRIGHRRVLMFCAIGAALFYFPQSVVQAAWQLLLLQALGGAALGGVIPAVSALLAQYTLPGEEGAVYGLDNSIAAAGRAVAPLVGALLALTLGLRGTFAATGGVFLLMGVLALWYLPQVKTGDQPHVA